jgi:hypothetical protein
MTITHDKKMLAAVTQNSAQIRKDNHAFINTTPVLMEDQSLLQVRANSTLRVKTQRKVDPK